MATIQQHRLIHQQAGEFIKTTTFLSFQPFDQRVRQVDLQNWRSFRHRLSHRLQHAGQVAVQIAFVGDQTGGRFDQTVAGANILGTIRQRGLDAIQQGLGFFRLGRVFRRLFTFGRLDRSQIDLALGDRGQ